METIYDLNGEEKLRIENIAEKLYQNREALLGKPISWDFFTTEYWEMPLPENELTTLQWKDRRIQCKNKINEQLIKYKYPCHLKSKFNYGVELMTGTIAVRDKITNGQKKTINVYKNNFEMFREMEENHPEARKEIRIMKAIYEENYYGLLGRVDNSRLPGQLRNELKRELQKALPQADEE